MNCFYVLILLMGGGIHAPTFLEFCYTGCRKDVFEM